MGNYTANDLMIRLEKLHEEMKNIQENKTVTLLLKLKDLQLSLINVNESDLRRLVEINFKITQLELEFRKDFDSRKIKTYIGLGGVVMLYVALYCVINNADFFRYLSLVTLSVVGALTYLVTDKLIKKDNIENKLVISVIMPFVLISVFIAEEGNLFQVSGIHLLSFVFGYSSEFVVLCFNTLIDKAKKILE